MSTSLHRRQVVAGGFALFTGLPGRAADLEIFHAQGRASLPAVPQRIAVFDLAALDILQALRAGVVGVPRVNFPPYLAEYADGQYARVGSLFEPDLPALQGARPDLIVIAGRSAGRYAELSAIAPTIDLSVSSVDYLAGVANNILLLGRLVGLQAEASDRAAQLLAAAAALQRQGAKAGSGLMLFAAGDTLLPQAPRTRFGVLYELAGIAPVMTEADAPAVSPRMAARLEEPSAAERQRRVREQVGRLDALLARDPDWLFVLDRPSATGGAAVAPALLAGHPGIARTTAARKRQVIYLDAPSWYLVGGGVQAVEQSIHLIRAAYDA